MRSNCAIYVDVGYLMAAAATRVTGTSLRSGVNVKYQGLVDALVDQAAEVCDLPVLRVHWYDSADKGVPSPQQERIGELAKVKLRLGRFGFQGEQKGVDLRIGLDLVAHARNGAVDVALLLSGDDDLTEAVEEAQAQGVQVIVLAVPNTAGMAHGLSRHLVRAADDVLLVNEQTIDATVLKAEVQMRNAGAAETAPVPEPVASNVASPSPRDLASRARPAPSPASSLAYSGTTGGSSIVDSRYEDPEIFNAQIDAVVKRVIASFRETSTPESAAIKASRPSIPRDIDRALLRDLSDALETFDLSDPIRFRLRDHFWDIFVES